MLGLLEPQAVTHNEEASTMMCVTADSTYIKIHQSVKCKSMLSKEKELFLVLAESLPAMRHLIIIFSGICKKRISKV